MENYWASKGVEIGNVRQGKELTLSFKALPTIPEVTGVRGECGCTKVAYDAANRILKVVYKAGNIPKHIPGNQVIDKKIVITYKDGTEDNLFIRGTKTR